MLRAVFVRTLKPGVTYAQFKDAWLPEGLVGQYPAKARVSRSLTDDRQVITIIEVNVPPGEFRSAASSLTRPDSRQRLGEIIETTQLEGVFEDIYDEGSLVR